MTGIYQLGQNGCIIRIADGACIPPDEANTDYANYLAWAAEGNVADADPAAANAAWVAYQANALQALNDSDIVVLRCYENSVAVPAAWGTYRKDLRAIIGITSGDATQNFPVKPAYPAGT